MIVKRLDAQAVHAMAYSLYEREGQFAVHDAVMAGTIPHDNWAYCEPCEIDSPMFSGACLVCSTERIES